MDEKSFDVAFLGGGSAGYKGALRAAQLGCRVAVIESQDLGGVCLNRGCIPTKAIRASVDALLKARRAKDYGLQVDVARPDMGAIMARKDKVVDLLRNGIAQLFRKNGVSLFEGIGKILSPDQLEVETKEGLTRIGAKKVVIGTGSRPILPGPFPAQDRGVFTTDNLFDIPVIPGSLLIVGAGAIGVEMASIMAGLGSTVTLLEMEKTILPREDTEMSAYLTRMLKRHNIKVITGISVTKVASADKMRATLSDGRVLETDAILVAAGRKANVERMGLENIGLDVANGSLSVNDRMETTIPGIYAAGDVVGGWLLAHVAFSEGVVAAENVAGIESRMDYRVIPRSIFSIPEYAAVGLTEEEAKKRYPTKAVSFPIKSLGMAQAMGEWEGLAKLIVNEKSGEILGGHIIGPHAGDLIAEVALAMRHNVPAQGVLETIHIHPTLSEAVFGAAQAACGQAIDLLPNGGSH